MGRWATGVAVAAFAVLAALVFYLVAGPLFDNDVWWHLAHGRAYLSHGPWIDVDPCLGTAERGPIPHSWLFDVAAHGVEWVAGLQGLRVAHALAVTWIGWLAFAAFSREVSRSAPAALATSIFLALAWYRLVQFRPEFFSIAAVLLLHRLLFAPALPSWTQVAGAAALTALWANVHALFMLGPLLTAACLAGVVARWVASRWAASGIVGIDADGERSRAIRLATALLACLLASLANPRGFAQHLAYLESSSTGAIQRVADEWARFDPLSHSNWVPAVSALAWVTTDLLLVLFGVTAAVLLWRLWRSPSAQRLEDCDPVRLALGVAGVVAMLSAVRFLWLAVFPLMFLLHALRRARRGRWTHPVLDASIAAAVVCLALAFPLVGGFREVATHYPKDLRSWILEAHTGHRFFEAGARFLRETGVTGQLFNDYALGGYLCYQLAPRVRTFVDGSMNFPDDVAVDQGNASFGTGTRPGESLAELLERRDVDLFFGFGVPVADAGAYTTAALEGHPHWRLVSRSWRHGVYLRAHPENRPNLERIATWYASQGIDFDPDRGFDPGAVLRQQPDWADAWGLLPEGWSDRMREVPRDDLKARVRALEMRGIGYALMGAYAEQVATDRRAARLRPRAKAPRRRLVYGLLRLGRTERALRRAQELVDLDPDDARSASFARVARQVADATSPDARIAAINTLPLLTSRRPLRQ